ncbi:MAG: hypothetical protein R3F11_17385 [Verrucomicrobiales bacterium]
MSAPVKTLEKDEAAHRQTGIATEEGDEMVRPEETLDTFSIEGYPVTNRSWKPRVFISYSHKDEKMREE